MTADEMFRELGYERAYEGTYRKWVNGQSVYEIRITQNSVEKLYQNPHYRISYGLTHGEIRAVAELLEEMKEHEQASIIE